MAEPYTTDDIMLAVANALDAWSRIEFALEGIFIAVSGMDHDRGSVVMASIVALEARLAVCNNLIERSAFSGSSKLFWGRFYNKVRKEMKKRNELAHFTIIRPGSLGPSEAKLLPYFTMGRVAMANGGNLIELNTADITARGERFAGLAAALRWFFGQLNDELGKPLASRAPATDLVRHFLRPVDPTPIENAPQPPP